MAAAEREQRSATQLGPLKLQTVLHSRGDMMGLFRQTPKIEQAAELVYRIRQDAIAAGDFHAYRAARELRDTLEGVPSMITSPGTIQMLEKLSIQRH
jgi:hypothetical protein